MLDNFARKKESTNPINYIFITEEFTPQSALNSWNAKLTPGEVFKITKITPKGLHINRQANVNWIQSLFIENSELEKHCDLMS